MTKRDARPQPGASTDGTLPAVAKKATTPLEATIRQPAPELGVRAQRTIDKLLAATRTVFLRKGYGGTSIDDITEEAGVSRATFYTYFPTKRDALLAIGAEATSALRAMIDELPVDEPPTTEILEVWLASVFEYLDAFGGFGFAWTQAAYEDEELRTAGMRTHLATCRRLGELFHELNGDTVGEPAHTGLIVFSMLERVWSQLRLYELSEPEVIGQTALLVHRMIRAD